MKSTGKIAAEFLATCINLIDPGFKAHICINGEFDNEGSEFKDSYRVFYEGKDSPNTLNGNYFTVYSLRDDDSYAFLNFEHKDISGVQDLLEFAFSHHDYAEKVTETYWSNDESNWLVSLDSLVDLIEDIRDPFEEGRKVFTEGIGIN